LKRADIGVRAEELEQRNDYDGKRAVHEHKWDC
jgi:hypothetical protein